MSPPISIITWIKSDSVWNKDYYDVLFKNYLFVNTNLFLKARQKPRKQNFSDDRTCKHCFQIGETVFLEWFPWTDPVYSVFLVQLLV